MLYVARRVARGSWLVARPGPEPGKPRSPTPVQPQGRTTVTLRPAARTAVALSAMAVTMAVAPVSSSAAADMIGPPVVWAPCTEAPLAGFECATYNVPLDHDRPAGATTPIALAR